jgi:hypothetical protein
MSDLPVASIYGGVVCVFAVVALVYVRLLEGKRNRHSTRVEKIDEPTIDTNTVRGQLPLKASLPEPQQPATPPHPDRPRLSFEIADEQARGIDVEFQKSESRLNIVVTSNASGEVTDFTLLADEPLRWSVKLARFERSADFQDFTPVTLASVPHRLFHDHPERVGFLHYRQGILCFSGFTESGNQVTVAFRTPGLWQIPLRTRVGVFEKEHALCIRWVASNVTIPDPCACSDAEAQRGKDSVTQASRDVKEQPNWRGHQARFESLKGSIDATWTYYTRDGDVSWYITSNKGTSIRDKQAFEAEATAAGNDLSRLPNPPQMFVLPEDASGLDRWMNALHLLVDSKNDIEISGFAFDRRRTVGGGIDDLVEASKVACARLAAGDLSRPAQVRQSRCFHLSGFVELLDKTINVAVEAGYTETARSTVDRTTEHIADWISYRFGPAQRRLWLTGPPYPQAYSAVPAESMADWQVSAGRLMRLRDLAQQWCDEP